MKFWYKTLAVSTLVFLLNYKISEASVLNELLANTVRVGRLCSQRIGTLPASFSTLVEPKRAFFSSAVRRHPMGGFLTTDSSNMKQDSEQIEKRIWNCFYESTQTEEPLSAVQQVLAHEKKDVKEALPTPPAAETISDLNGSNFPAGC